MIIREEDYHHWLLVMVIKIHKIRRNLMLFMKKLRIYNRRMNWFIIAVVYWIAIEITVIIITIIIINYKLLISWKSNNLYNKNNIRIWKWNMIY